MNFYNNKYSEEKLREFAKQDLSKCNCSDISRFHDLSESFINEFQNKVNWIYISQCQNLSENFILEFEDKISWQYLRYNRKIQVSDEFTIEFDEKLGCNNYWRINYQSHRILGPAKIWSNGEKEYYYRGKQVKVKSDEEYFKWLRVKDF